MKVIETRPRDIGFVLWGHCQNLLDDPRILKTLVVIKEKFRYRDIFVLTTVLYLNKKFRSGLKVCLVIAICLCFYIRSYLLWLGISD